MDKCQRAFVAVLGLAVGACATDPDIVATGQTLKDASAGFPVKPVNGCYPGLYTGTFNNSTNPDAQSLLPISGEIHFSLVQANSGEFLTVESGAKLSGSSDQGNTFSADIDTDVDGGGGGCREGAFKVDLANGKYYTVAPDAGTPTDFYGTVEGSYRPDEKNFFGKWKVFVPVISTKTPFSQGEWYAGWHLPIER